MMRSRAISVHSIKMILPFIVRLQTVEGFEPNAGDREALHAMLGQFGKTGQEKNGSPSDG